MGKLLDLKLEIDHRLISVVNLYRFKSYLMLNAEQRFFLKKSSRSILKRKSGRILLCGNGPSLDELDFSKFSNEDVIAANYFYKHPNARLLNPNYYVIIDSKITNGVWPITMIDDIFNTLPNVTLFLDIRWLNMEIFTPYKHDDRICWILPNFLPHAFSKPKRHLHYPLCGLNVVATEIGIATSIGFDKLGIAGVDGDGLFREILDRPSHFYDGVKDISLDSFESMVKSLVLSAENLWAWQGIVAKHKENNINIVNLCKGGIMDCMPRVSVDLFLNQ